MDDTYEFKGFPKEMPKFYGALSRNNNKDWFADHRSEFDQHVMDPARLFVSAMGDKLRDIAPGINADPRVNRSLFRINRDTRFSKNKTPYKTNLAIWFWEGVAKRMECSGYYVHIEADKLMIGVGLYQFPADVLEKYREYVVDDKHGKSLEKAIKKVTAGGEYTLGGSHFKRVPRGYDPDHKNVGMLLYNGLFAGVEMGLPDELYTPGFVDFCLSRFKDMAPLHNWLYDLTAVPNPE